MVRKILLFQLLWLVLAVMPARAATLTVCDGTSIDNHLPLFGYYADSFAKSEVIIPADSLQDMVDCPITAMRWYIQSRANTEWGATFRVFVKEVEQRTFDAQGSFSGPGTIVYEGSLSGTGTEMDVTFDAPYVYQGGNLLIGVYTVVPSTYSSCYFYGISTTSWDDPATGLYSYNSASLDAINTGTQVNFIPKTTFTYTGSGEITAPFNLVASNVTSESATLSWTPGGNETSWNVAYKEQADEQWIQETVTTTSYQLSDLTAGTTFDIRVQAVVGDNVSAWCTGSFSTPYCNDSNKGEVAFSLSDSYGDGWNGNAIQVVNSATGVVEYTLSCPTGVKVPKTYDGVINLCYGVQYDFLWVKGSYPGEVSFSFTEPNDQVAIYNCDGTASSFATGDTIFSYTLEKVAFARPTNLTASNLNHTSADLNWTAGGEETAWQIVYDTNANFDPDGIDLIPIEVSGTPSYTFTGLTENTTYYAYVRGNYGDGNMSKWSDVCSFSTLVQFPTPTDLTVTDVTTESATLSWTPGGDETSWNVAYKEQADEQWIQETVTTTSYELSDLAAATVYDVRVQSVFGDDVSQWVTSSFSTPLCEGSDKVAFDYALVDSYGDGWNGNYITVVNTSTYEVEATLTITDGSSATGTLMLCSGITYNFVWNSGSYPGECSFDFYDEFGDVLYTCSSGSSLSNATIFFTYTPVKEDYPRPTDFTANNVTYNSADLIWAANGAETAWQIVYDTKPFFDPDGIDLIPIVVTEHPYTTLENLAEGTIYYAYVRANHGDGNFSNWSSVCAFTTPERYARPTDLAVTDITDVSATATWADDEADSHTLRYRITEPIINEGFEGGELPEGWTLIDADGDGFNWTLYERADNTDNNGNRYCIGNFCISSASWDSNTQKALTPDNWLVTPQVQLGGSLSFFTRAQDPDYPDEKIEVYVSTTGTEVADFMPVTNSIICPVDTALTQYSYDLSNFSGQGYIAIRHYDCTDNFMVNIDDFMVTAPANDEEWTVVENATSPCELSNLEAGSFYELQVQANYENGSSKWTPTMFTTMAADAVPTDLTAENITYNSADIQWSGIHESYNLRYRESGINSLFSDFEGYVNGLSDGGWTIVDNDGDGNKWLWGTGNSPYMFGDYCALSWSVDRNNNNTPLTNVDNWLISEEIELGETLSFWARGLTGAENFSVYLSTDGSEVSDFEGNVLIAETTTTDVLTEYTADLSAYAGQTGRIAFRHTGGAYGLIIDNVKVETTPAGEWISVPNVTSPYTFEEPNTLKPTTSYDVQVQGIYGEEELTDWSEMLTFTTDEFKLTLANALAGENGDIIIEDSLTVVVANDNYAIVSDGKGNWLKVVGNNTIGNYAGVTLLDGTLSNVELNPELYVYRYNPTNEADEVELKHLDLRTIHRTALTELKPNEVADFMGYYNAETGELCAFSSGSGLHIAMTTDNMVGAISTGKQQKFTGVVSLKEAWNAPSGAPARVALDDDLAFENIQIDATAASVATGVETVKMLDGKEIEGIYNVNGQRVSRADKGVYIIRFQDGTTQKVRF